MVNYNYQWHLSQHNAQQYRDTLEDQFLALIELQKKSIKDQGKINQKLIEENLDIKSQLDMINSILSELVQDRLHMDLLID